MMAASGRKSMFNDFLDYRDMLRYHGAGKGIERAFCSG
jgi:hypothetical protein